MRISSYFFLYLLSVIVLVITAILLPSPGYMDADYYYAGAYSLVSGNGFNEPFIWNYLDSPVGIPHPAFTYWMPLPSLIAALGMKIAGSKEFWAARFPFVLLAGFVAPMTAWLAFRLSSKRNYAWMAGLLAIGCGYYLPYLPTTSTFTPAMVLGTGYIAISASLFSKNQANWLGRTALLGLTAGLIHLNRADGLIWAILAGSIILVAIIINRYEPTKLLGLAVFSAVYLLVCGGWYLRNWIVYGSLFPDGSNLAIWFTGYDDLYTINPSAVTAQRWMASGLAEIIQVRLTALGQNLLRAAAVQGQILLIPLIFLGVWTLRKNPIVKHTAVLWICILGIMSVIFPYAGMRGGFFHSGAMVQPVLWALVPVGLEKAVLFGVKHRGWRAEPAWRVFATGIVVICMVISVGIILERTVNTSGDSSGYAAAGEVLNKLSVPTPETVLVNNPPGFYLATGRPSIVIPSGDSAQTLTAAIKYGGRFLVLDQNNNSYLGDLYQSTQGDGHFKPVGQVGEIRIFEIVP